MAKVCLLYFDLNTGYYPGVHHGLAYIIGTLKNANHEVTLRHLIDENDLDATAQILEKEDPDLVCLSFTTNQRKYVRSFLTKTDLSTKLTIAGGVHCTLTKENIFKEFPEINGICIGEGEFPLKDLCKRIDNKEEYLSTPSFYFNTKDGIVKNSISALQNIDALSLPDYSLFNYDKIISENGDCFPMMLGRGCPYSCHYCCNHAIRRIYPNKNIYVRFPIVQHAIKIIKNNLSIYPNTRKISFADDTFTLNRKWLFEFCENYKSEIGLPFICNARVETISEQVVRHLKYAGCVSLDFGVESGNEWLRKHILNRRHSNKKIRKTFHITKEYGIKRFSFNIVGLPFETKEMAKDTLDLNLELRPNFGKCFYFYPYPGTILHQICLDYDLISDNADSVSGYLERPSLKELFMPHKEIKKQFELMNLFFYTRLLFSRIRIPLLLEKFLLKTVFLLRNPISKMLDPTSTSKKMIVVRKMLRKLTKKYLR